MPGRLLTWVLGDFGLTFAFDIFNHFIFILFAALHGVGDGGKGMGFLPDRGWRTTGAHHNTLEGQSKVEHAHHFVQETAGERGLKNTGLAWKWNMEMRLAQLVWQEHGMALAEY